jgi:hypothetical protein
MSEPEMTNEQYVEAVYTFAAEQMRDGVAPAKIKASLIEKGVDEESAGVVVRNLKEARSKAIKEAANKNMLFGALWCIGGIVVTALTYSAAAGGGRYVVAWGAVVFGAIQFVRGLAQSVGE